MKPFYLLPKFPIFKGLKISRRDKQKRQFPYKKTAYATGRKNKFFQFLFCFESSHRDETFLFLPKFHILNGSKILCMDKQKLHFLVP